MNVKEVQVDGLKQWKLLLNEGFEVTEELKKTITTIEEGMTNGINFIILGNAVLFPFAVSTELDFDQLESQGKEAMERTLKNTPDMNPIAMFTDNFVDVVGGLVSMPDGVVGVLHKEEVIIKENTDNLDITSALLGRTKIFESCEQGKVMGFLISL